MRRIVTLSMLVILAGLLVAAAYAASANFGGKLTPNGFVPFYGTTPANAGTVRPATVKLWASQAGYTQISFWRWDGSAWSKMPLFAAVGDTALTVPIAGFDLWEFAPGNGPDAVYVSQNAGLSISWEW